MNQTPNYALPSWEATDRILMEDFNDMTEKVDAAIAGRLGRSQLLQTITPEHNASSVRISLESMNWNDWEVVLVHAHCTGVSNNTDKLLTCGVCDGRKSAYCSAGSSLLQCPPSPVLLVLLPRHDASRNVLAFYVGASSGMGWTDFSFSQLTALNFSALYDWDFSSDQKITVWGIQ